MRIVALVNQKGGCAKTTSAINIAAGLSQNRKVLLTDLDPQGNLTEGFGIDPDSLGNSIYDVIVGGARIADVRLNLKPGLDILPANIDLSGAEAELLQLPGKDYRLKKALSDDDLSYDYIIIDCPPSLGQLTLNALSAATEIYIPVQCEFFALKGLAKLMNTVEMVKKWSNSGVDITGVICTRYDNRKNLSREVVAQLRKHFGALVFNTLIRDNISLAEAPSVGKEIYSYKTGSKGANDYMALCAEIIAREGRTNG